MNYFMDEVPALSSSSKAFSRRPAESQLEGVSSLDRHSESAMVSSSGFCRKTHSLGFTAVGIGPVVWVWQTARRSGRKKNTQTNTIWTHSSLNSLSIYIPVECVTNARTAACRHWEIHLWQQRRIGDNNFDAISLTVFPSNVESLKKGIIKTSKNKANASYTTFLGGETGVGKSSVFKLIANVLAGNDIDHHDLDILDRANEQGGSNNQRPTRRAFTNIRARMA